MPPRYVGQAERQVRCLAPVDGIHCLLPCLLLHGLAIPLSLYWRHTRLAVLAPHSVVIYNAFGVSFQTIITQINQAEYASVPLPNRSMMQTR